MSDEWIKINGEADLPLDRVSRLVWCPERKNKYTAYWSGNFWHHFGGLGGVLNEEVTHWMFLPDPPEAK